MRSLLVGSEAWTSSLIESWTGEREIRNAYGPTESTVCVTISDPVQPGQPIHLGRALPGNQLYVLDPWLRPVPPGVVGELYIGGAQVGRGYRNQPALTSTRFVPDPFAAPGRRMYRSGDLASYNRHGILTYHGRSDQQIKLRGYRIELGEIETAILSCPGVTQAVARLHTDPATGHQQLIGYAATSRPELTGEDIRRHAAHQLPTWMLPASITTLPAIPLTPNGKTDHAQLPPPHFATTNARTPQPGAEQRLCTLFAEFLDLSAVGPDDDFFALGGHSLLAYQLITAIESEFGRRLSLPALFALPTPAGIAEALGRAEPVDNASGLLALRTTGSRAPLYCLHPASGISLCYAGLTEWIPDRPIYGLQLPQLTDPALAGDDLATLIEGYLARIRTVHPGGEFHLLGWSLGGNLAHALACRLQQLGERVGTLTLLDSYPPGPQLRTEELSPVELAEMLERAGSRRRAAADPEFLRVLAARASRALRLVTEAAPPTFDGDLRFFSATLDREPELGAELWQPYVSGTIEDNPVRSAHLDLTQPAPLAEIGRRVGRSLERCP